jgi:hypothetical protein
MATYAVVKKARHDFLSTMPTRFKDRKWALDRIAAARSPANEAKRLVDWFQRRGIYKGAAVNANAAPDAIDLSDCQEVRASLIKKHGAIYPSCPQAHLLNALERDVVSGAVAAREEFNAAVARIVAATTGLTPAHANQPIDDKANLFSGRALSPALVIKGEIYD